jgi:E3 ubiquitin-protein ligase TRIP12
VGRKGNRELREEGHPAHNFVLDDEDDDMEGDDFGPFGRDFLGRNSAATLAQARSLIGGLMPSPGTASKFRGLLESIKMHQDPTIQHLAMEELAELLLVSSEDSLNAQFSPDAFVKELIIIMQGGEGGNNSSDLQDLACRCIANLLEALPQAAHSVVASGTIPVLCEKLMHMVYIEQAEQAMTTLSKISDEYPGSIVREGGLKACLMNLDFFPTYMQKTAVSTAAKCCHDLSDTAFPAVLEAMPILLGVLNNADQDVVKQGALCITRIITRFGSHARLEELVSQSLLQAIFRLLLPGSASIVGEDVQTRFLGILAIVARASPSLSASLLKMDVVDILYQILTGVSPPQGNDDISSKIDGVLVMQALIHKPRDQIFGALNVICEILPEAKVQPPSPSQVLSRLKISGEMSGVSAKKRKSLNLERIRLLDQCNEQVKRFAMILLPTLTHAYDITVNLNVRNTVLNAQLKMLSNLDSSILESALRPVPFASFLASILSQEDHNDLVLQALQATELLLTRLKPIYAYQFCREGVLAEIIRLAKRPISENAEAKADTPVAEKVSSRRSSRGSKSTNERQSESDQDGDHEDEDDEDPGDFHEEMTHSPSSSSDEDRPTYQNPVEKTRDAITTKARSILETYQDSKSQDMRRQAEQILTDASAMANNLRDSYAQESYLTDPKEGYHYFESLAQFFSNDALKSITSAELLNSDIIEVLLDLLDPASGSMGVHARSDFVEVFMQTPRQRDESITAFNVLVHKLQDLLSRAEHLEVVTVHNNSQETARMDRDNLSYQLGKQLRLRLEADEQSGVPAKFKNIIVSIHAITTFKSLNDYLRPRMMIRDPASMSRRSDMISTLAALAGSAGSPHHQRLLERTLLTRGDPSNLPPFEPGTPSQKPRDRLSEQSTPQVASQQDSKPNRRTSRRHQSRNQLLEPPETPKAPKSPTQTLDQSQDPLECADERPLDDDEPDEDDDDDEDDDEDDEDELDAFVEDLEDEMDDEPTPDPSAVNLEVASTGKVTARQEDGTRVPTPAQNTPSALAPPPSRNHGTSSPYAARALSYAAVAQSTPQDWHLEFSIDGQKIPLDTTIYRAVHYNRLQPNEISARSVWSSTHAIKFKKVLGTPSSESTSLSGSPADKAKLSESLPESLHQNPVASNILRLLGVLHDLNGNLGNIFDDHKQARIRAEPAALFVNTKLTAKLNRQLEEPLIVASRCLPQWSEDLVRLYPFLFPFEARYLFLQSKYFGYHRSIERWIQSHNDDSRRDRRREDKPYLSIPKKQKVRIARERLFDSAVKVLELYGASSSTLEIEYFEEVGTGLGPTLEFYSNVSKEFVKRKLKLWRENDTSEGAEYAFGKAGLFPRPMSDEQAASEDGKRILHMFRTLGKFVARSMLDSRMIDISFNPLFFRIDDITKSALPPLAAVKQIDEDLAKSLKHVQNYIDRKNALMVKHQSAQQKANALHKIQIEIDALGLDFTLPGYPIELVRDGSNIALSVDNIELFLEKVIDFTIGHGVERQIQEFQAGFSQVFPYFSLDAFTPAELVMLFGNTEEDWSIASKYIKSCSTRSNLFSTSRFYQGRPWFHC